MGHELIGKVERGDPVGMTIDRVARYAAAVGLELAAQLHPSGDPIRDRAHLDLIARFRARLGSNARVRIEVPVPIAGDPRSGDVLVGVEGGVEILVEAETRLGDVQLVQRRASAKRRDLGAQRLVLLVSDTRHNREIVRLHPELLEWLPVQTRAAIAALSRGLDPGGDALVVL